MDRSRFEILPETEVGLIDCSSSFQQLTNNEKHYAHHLSKASWWMGLISMSQCSPETPKLFEFMLKLFSKYDIEILKLNCGEDWKSIFAYFAAVFGNLGNYQGFGDTKIIPSISKESFEKIIPFEENEDGELKILWNSISEKIFSLNESVAMFGYPDEKVSEYYSPNITKLDIEITDKYIAHKSIFCQNTRLFKENETLIIKVASIKEKETKPEIFMNKTFIIRYGDFKEYLMHVVAELELAKEYCTEIEKEMIELYIKHFQTGNMKYYHESQKIWVKILSPTVETNMGFIETYRDPHGIRAECEGWVACVDKVQSEKFQKLVSLSEEILPLLPWPQEFEKSQFIKPDFTSLDIISFGCAGVPSGINIPNSPFNDEGYKNLNLQNVILSKLPKDKISFLSPQDNEIVIRCYLAAYSMQVGLHEMYGHGSGLNLVEGQFPEDLTSPLDGEPVSFYKPGQTFDNVFTTLASAIEECRAECTALHLDNNPLIIELFAGPLNVDELIYTNWVTMCRAGLTGLMFYVNDKWMQAHCHARFAIFQTLYKVGVVSFDINEEENDFILKIDRNRIESHGRDAISKLLLRLAIYRFTADSNTCKPWFEKLTTPNEEMLKLREIVIAKRKPRMLLVQINTILDDEDVILQKFQPSFEGIIKSFVTRFQGLY